MEEIDILQRQRDRKFVELARNFLLTALTHRRCQEKYKQGSLCFADLARLIDDRGESVLYGLKESCQALFRRNSSFISEKEQIFDLTVGSIFHLAMKMREDLYQLEVYGPKVLALTAKGQGFPAEGSLLKKFQEILYRAQASFQEGTEEIGILMSDASRQFQELLCANRENGLLIRFLLEEKELVREVLGGEAPESTFCMLYEENDAEAYRLAGESYFNSAFYNQAMRAFTCALEKNPGDENLQFKIHLSQGMEQFYSFAPLHALRSFEKCLGFSERVEFLESYRAMIRKVCQKILEEFPGRRKIDQHRDLVKKAKNLQRQLECLPPASSELYPT